MNMFKNLSNAAKTAKTSGNREPGMVRNNAGGLGHKVNDWDQLMRFLILGTTGGTFYVNEEQLTELNVEALERCLDADPRRAVETICQVSKEGRAASNDPAVFALAVAISRLQTRVIAGDGAKPDRELKEPSEASQLALARFAEVTRTFTDYSHLLTYLSTMRGWGRGLQRGLSRYYTERPVGSLEYQLVKYWQRDGYSQQDAFRLTHPASFATPEPARRLLWDYAAKGVVPSRELLLANGLTKLAAYGELQHPEMTPADAARIVRESQLPMEAVPTHLRTAEVYETVLFSEGNGMTWLLRNLVNLASQGVLVEGRQDVIRHVCGKLTDEEELKRQRLHPLAILKAHLTYKEGRSERPVKKEGRWDYETKTWPVVQRVLAALDRAFKMSFRYAPASGKRLLLAVDVSGSMVGSNLPNFSGLGLQTAAAIMAIVVANVEPEWTLVGFDDTDSTYPLELRPTMTVEELARAMARGWGRRTDLTDPLRWARRNKVAVDGIVTFTDGETWRNRLTPSQELDLYAQALGHRPKVVNVAMTATHVTPFGEDDANMLEVVGFDTQVPEAISLFMTN